MADKKVYKVIDGPLSIRKTANGEGLREKLAQGVEIEGIGETVIEGDYIWVQHDKGWSAFGEADGGETYMQDISDRDPNAPRIFRIWTSRLSIREKPSGTRLAEKLYRKTEISVDPQSRTEVGNYVWWKHDKGWSAECSTNGYQIFMKEVFDKVAATPLDPSKKVKIPEHWKGTFFLQVAQNVKVRGEPSTDPRGLVIRTVKRGKVLECDMDTLIEADYYYWVRHDLGWSAITSIDGKAVFLAEPGTIPGLVAIGPNGPKAEDLPGYQALFTQFPVNLDDTHWFQYFGNNMFAMRKGTAYGYDRYAQGLHAGLDFGNSDKPVPIYAGLEAEYVKTDYPSPNNRKIYLKKDDYIIIYQHIAMAHSFTEGQIITPDTQLGLVEHYSINNGWNHLHFEIRFMKDWIINPLHLFTPELYAQLVKKFKPEKPNTGYQRDFPKSKSNFFYLTETWTKWTTPLEQPMIKLAGPVIGPRGEFDRSEW